MDNMFDLLATQPVVHDAAGALALQATAGAVNSKL